MSKTLDRDMAANDRDMAANDRDIPTIDRDMAAIDRDMACASKFPILSEHLDLLSFRHSLYVIDFGSV